MSTWIGLKCFNNHVPHSSAADVLVDDHRSLQLRLSTQGELGEAQGFLLQGLLGHAVHCGGDRNRGRADVIGLRYGS